MYNVCVMGHRQTVLVGIKFKPNRVRAGMTSASLNMRKFLPSAVRNHLTGEKSVLFWGITRQLWSLRWSLQSKASPGRAWPDGAWQLWLSQSQVNVEGQELEFVFSFSENVSPCCFSTKGKKRTELQKISSWEVLTNKKGVITPSWVSAS